MLRLRMSSEKLTTDSKEQVDSVRPIEFEFDKHTMIRVDSEIVRYSCCGWLSDDDAQTIREYPDTMRLSIENGHLIYERGATYHTATLCGRKPMNYVPGSVNTVPLSQIQQMKTAAPSNSCCVRNPLVYVSIDTPAHSGPEMSIYGLKDPAKFIKTVAQMVRSEKQLERNYHVGGGGAAALPIVGPKSKSA